MDLYLFRHGIATEPSEGIHDAERPLIPKGQRRTRQMARRLRQLGLTCGVLLTSPYLRARQTADILQAEQLHCGTAPIVFPPLAPGGNYQGALTWLGDWQQQKSKNPTVIMVGHQPDLGNWATQFLWGDVSIDKIILKKAGVIGLRLTGLEQSTTHHQLFLLTSPKWIL